MVCKWCRCRTHVKDGFLIRRDAAVLESPTHSRDLGYMTRESVPKDNIPDVRGADPGWKAYHAKYSARKGPDSGRGLRKINKFVALITLISMCSFVIFMMDNSGSINSPPTWDPAGNKPFHISIATHPLAQQGGTYPVLLKQKYAVRLKKTSCFSAFKHESGQNSPIFVPTKKIHIFIFKCSN